MAVVKATLHSVNRVILRCILIVYYITNQTSTSCNIVLCCDSPYCVPCIFNDMFTPLLWKLSKIYINMILFQIKTNNGSVRKSKHATSMNTFPVLASQFFKINYSNTLKNTIFTTVDLMLIVKPEIIIIASNTD